MDETAAAPTAELPDVKSRRWLVAIHEAAHVAAARTFDWRVTRVLITAGGGGLTSNDSPWLREKVRVTEEFAVVHLAGPVADEKLLHLQIPDDREYRLDEARKVMAKIGMPYGCELDLDAARRLLLRTEVTYPEGMARARRVVHQRWPEIERIARVLYARGQLNGAQVKVAAKAG